MTSPFNHHLSTILFCFVTHSICTPFHARCWSRTCRRAICLPQESVLPFCCWLIVAFAVHEDALTSSLQEKKHCSEQSDCCLALFRLLWAEASFVIKLHGTSRVIPGNAVYGREVGDCSLCYCLRCKLFLDHSSCCLLILLSIDCCVHCAVSWLIFTISYKWIVRKNHLLADSSQLPLFRKKSTAANNLIAV